MTRRGSDGKFIKKRRTKAREILEAIGAITLLALFFTMALMINEATNGAVVEGISALL